MNKKRISNWPYHTMMMPGIIMLFIFNVIPIFGIIMAFQKYNVLAPWWGFSSPFVGLKNFHYIFVMHPSSRQVIINTVIIAFSKMVLTIVVPVAFALLLNECLNKTFKRAIQTIVYLPNFLSWVVAGAMFRQMFAPNGLLNMALAGLHITSDPIIFMQSNTWFRPLSVFSEIWKTFGYSAVVYISAITSIDVALYEAAEIDGAGRWQKMFFITMPGIMPTIILMSTLALGNILNAGFDQIFNMYNEAVYTTGDVLDTFVYRTGIVSGKYDVATALGLSKSVISMLLIVLSYKLADRFAGYRIF